MTEKTLSRSGRTDHRVNTFFSLCPLRRTSFARSLWLILFLFSACTPAHTPPILDATPGAAVVVTDDSYRSDIFSVRYPAGWRVITSQAGSPPTATLVSPDNCALIVVSAAAISQPPLSPSCDRADLQSVARNITLGSAEIALAGSAPADAWDAFLTTFERIAASLESAT